MKIILGRQIEEIKKKNSENEKNLLKNRNSDELNELDADDIYFHSNTIKNIKLGTNTVNRIYLNNSIVYELENTIDFNLFHSLVPNTATEIRFLYASNNPDLTDYQRIGYADNNNFIEVWNSGTKYILINPRKNYIYAPTYCASFFRSYTALSDCIFDNFNTENVTNMDWMFYNCSGLTSLDLSNFNTQNVRKMHRMFSLCTLLTTIISYTFNTYSISDSGYMFLDSTNLVGGNGTTYSRSHLSDEYARVDGENGLPGYFTAPANK